jgi:hypothetical protein
VPQTIKGGPVTLKYRNSGKAEHELAFVKVGDTSLDTFKKEFPAVLQGGPIPAFLTDVSVPLDIKPGQSESRKFTLSPGRWLLMCALQDQPGPQDDDNDELQSKQPPHYELGMAQFVSVEGSSGSIDGPDGTVTASDYTFDVPQLRGGPNKLVFRNAGPKQFHFGDLMKFAPGVTPEQAEAQFAQALAAGENAPPPPGVQQPEEVAFSGIFSPGLESDFDVTLESGRTYLFACFLQDRAGGPPHAIKYKMFKAFSVS